MDVYKSRVISETEKAIEKEKNHILNKNNKVGSGLDDVSIISQSITHIPQILSFGGNIGETKSNQHKKIFSVLCQFLVMT